MCSTEYRPPYIVCTVSIITRQLTAGLEICVCYVVSLLVYEFDESRKFSLCFFAMYHFSSAICGILQRSIAVSIREAVY